MMENIETELQRYNMLKAELFQVCHCIDCCAEEEEKEFYRNVAIQYTKEMKRTQKVMCEMFGITPECFGGIPSSQEGVNYKSMVSLQSL
jgi:hypothetical protein